MTEDEQCYFDLGGRRGPLVSGEGLRLHIDAIKHSVRRGTPGYVPDSYLNELGAHTTTAAAELCLAGVWERVIDGYRLHDQDFLDQVASIQNAKQSWWRGRRPRLV